MRNRARVVFAVAVVAMLMHTASAQSAVAAALAETNWLLTEQLCSGTLTRTCDTGFAVGDHAGKSSVYSLNDATSGIDSKIKILRWMCTCTADGTANGPLCTADNAWAPCTCTRSTAEGYLENVVRYYEFTSAYCDSTAPSATEAVTIINKIQGEYSTQGDDNVQNIEAIISAGTPAPTSAPGYLLGTTSAVSSTTPAPTPATCFNNDDSKCINFSMDPTECTFASFSQLEKLIADSSSGSNTFLEYMTSQLGVPNDYTCIKKVRASAAWSPATSVTLPDQRTGRKLMVPGVPAKDSWIRKYSVKPVDATNVAFVTMQMKFDPAKGESADEGKITQRIKGAMQVKLCKDGSVHGITSTARLNDGFTNGVPGKYVQQAGCNGKDTYLKVDNVFRKAVALARFELAKKFEEWTNTACNKTTWDGLKCMNSFFPNSRKCHIVDATVVPSGPFGMNSLRMFTDGWGSAAQLYATGDGNANTNGNGAKDCANGQCSFKVCAEKLVLHKDGALSGTSLTGAKLAWKKPSDGTTTIEIDVSNVDGTCKPCPCYEWETGNNSC